MLFDEIVESLIKEAQERGEFENLSGQGKPIDLTDYFNTPENIRVAQSILKNAGMVPVEIELLREISDLKESLNSGKSAQQTEELRKKLADKQLQLNMMLESSR